MKNFNILGVHVKIRVLRGRGGFTKNQYIWGIAYKSGGGELFFQNHLAWNADLV